MFLDADDMFEDYACEVMYNLAKEKEADYISANYIMMDEDDNKREKPAFDTEIYRDCELNLNNLAKNFVVMNSTLWNKIYKTSVFKDNGITFSTSVNEDVMYLYENAIYAKRFAKVDKAFVHYVIRQGSLMHDYDDKVKQIDFLVKASEFCSKISIH